jgi:hypothetical protein
MVIEVGIKNIHLAAYIKTFGGKLIDIQNNKFIFESEKSIQDWQLQHSNSESLMVDRELLTLKRIVYNK